MTRKRKLLFSAIVVVFVFCLIEGSAQIIWWRLQSKALATRHSAGQEVLRNDALNFMKEPHGLYGYVMKPNFSEGSTIINAEGFHQREAVPVARQQGRFRVVCLGESTTFGSSVESNYPHFLRAILAANAGGHTGYEVINAGVPGWVSDQVALRAEHQMADYAPDAVILYVGWNDFQSYSPFASAPTQSYFDVAYKGNEWKQYAAGWFKSVALLSALYHRDQAPDAQAAPATSIDASPEARYRFLLQNLDRIVTAFRQKNPGVRVYISTLVGRWPAGTAEEWEKIAPVWWMPPNKVTPDRAADLVVIFNNTLRRYAESRGLSLMDVAGAFDSLDRARLQFDWAHMYSDGYELMAWTMFEALVSDALVTRRGAPSRPQELRARYSSRAADVAVARTAETPR